MSGRPSEDLASLGATEMVRRMKLREISPVEVLEQTVRRIERRNPSINGMVFCDFEAARERARQAERLLMSGHAVGPLHGVPIAMKDNIECKPNWITTFGGVRALRGHVVHTESLFVRRMEAAGAIVVGKTNAPVFGFRGTTDNYLFGASRNPFNVVKNAGGSSGGSAAVVADGLLPLAQGADGGGSIRIPASWCGVYGFKASFGRVPWITRPDAFGGTAPFLSDGAITRSVEDSALALSVLAQYHSGDPYSSDVPFDALGAIKRPIRDWKIAYTRNYGIFPVEPEVLRVTEKALLALEEAGARVEEVKIDIPRSQRELSDVWCRIAIQGWLSAMEDLKQEGIDLLRDHPADLPPEVRHWCEVGRNMTLGDYQRDQKTRSQVYQVVTDLLERYRLLVAPTLACLPVDNAQDGNTVGPREINGESIDPLIGWCMTYLINFTGHPAASVPAGLSQAGLPVGLQIVGRRHADEDVLAASAAMERHRPWIQSYRTCEARPLSAR